jgi:hypothetical protein
MEPQKQLIYQHYANYVTQNKGRPLFLFRFLDATNVDESEFRSLFKSFKQLEREFWLDLFNVAKTQIESEEIYLEYSIRERLLAFYFTWIEYLKEYREYIQWTYNHKYVWDMWPGSMTFFQKHFKTFIQELVKEGKMSQEVADRPVITDYYGNLLWLQLQFVLKFWLRDKSENFDNTDAAIEKAVNFSMDMINSNYVDSFFGLSKFVIQKW